MQKIMLFLLTSTSMIFILDGMWKLGVHEFIKIGVFLMFVFSYVLFVKEEIEKQREEKEKKEEKLENGKFILYEGENKNGNLNKNLMELEGEELEAYEIEKINRITQKFNELYKKGFHEKTDEFEKKIRDFSFNIWERKYKEEWSEENEFNAIQERKIKFLKKYVEEKNIKIKNKTYFEMILGLRETIYDLKRLKIETNKMEEVKRYLEYLLEKEEKLTWNNHMKLAGIVQIMIDEARERMEGIEKKAKEIIELELQEV